MELTDISEKDKIDLIKKGILRDTLLNDFLRFTKYFFKVATGDDMKVNWHHYYFASICEDIYKGKRKNVVINVSPGSSKTMIISIMFPLWCFAKNPHQRFLCTSYSDTLVDKNSVTIKDILKSKQWEDLFPGYSFKQDTNSKKEWVVLHNDEFAGEYTAVSLGGQITGRRAGFMSAKGFSGCIIVDDPLKPEDAWSDSARDARNRVLCDTLRSRKGNSETPIIVIMQRLHSEDCTDFLVDKKGMGDTFDHIVIPAKIDFNYIDTLPDDIKRYAHICSDKFIEKYGYSSYWNFKEPIEELQKIEESSIYTFSSQYMQNPVPAGGIVFRREWWMMEETLPYEFDYVRITADTAMKTKTYNDYSVLFCYGVKDNNIYVLNIIRGKWEAPELFTKTFSFYKEAKARFGDKLRSIHIEDKASGIGLIQSLKKETRISVIPVNRDKDKVSRAMLAQPHIQSGRVHVPRNMSWTKMFIDEMSQFTKNDAHAHDDIVDCMVTAIEIEFIVSNKVRITNYLI